MAKKKQERLLAVPSQPFSHRLADENRDLRSEVWRLERQIDDMLKMFRKNARRYDDVWFDHERTLWYSHLCLGQKVDTKLDDWKIGRDGKVTPSVSCLRCKAHFNIEVQVKMTYMEGFVYSWFGQQRYTQTHTREENPSGSSNGHPSGADPQRDRDVLVERDSGGAGSREVGVREEDGRRDVPRVREGRPGSADAGP